MKKLLFTVLVFVYLTPTIFSQTTATNFTVSDCAGIPHDLFSELDEGKIIVIAWVMPCGTCAAPSLAAYNAVQSYAGSYPNKVHFYLVDDYANTSCATLSSWGNTNSMPLATKFSNAVISMSDYGTDGMPKIVVLGGADHAIVYNQNSGVTTANVQGAINSLLTADVNNVTQEETLLSLKVVPNPASEIFYLNYSLQTPSKVSIGIYTADGRFVQSLELKEKPVGNYSQEFLIDDEFANGMFIIKVKTDHLSESIKFIMER